MRWKAVIDATLESSFTNNLLLAAGLLSVFIGVSSLVIQRHYKRMLAYSSVEHIGLVSLGLGLGPLGTFAAFLHLVNHAVAKSMAFLLSRRASPIPSCSTVSMRPASWTAPQHRTRVCLDSSPERRESTSTPDGIIRLRRTPTCSFPCQC